MSEPIRGVVVAHADLAAALTRAVECIAGVADALAPISNDGSGPEEVRRAVETAVGGGPAIVFTDLSSGSCALVGRMVAGHRNQVAVLTGANLPMLLDFVFHREMEFGPLVERLVSKGRGGISVSPKDPPRGAPKR
ncbi:MAG: PTS sugar transporter subunit IIA [Gemmatimonadota bacterium]